MAIVTIQLPHHRYEIRIEPGALQGLGDSVRALAPHGQCAVLADPAVQALYGEAAEKSLASAGYAPVALSLEPGEEAKSLASVERIYGLLLDAHLERRSPLVALGGGITGDVTGFEAQAVSLKSGARPLPMAKTVFARFWKGRTWFSLTPEWVAAQAQAPRLL